MEETWKEIPGYHYSISSWGRIRNDSTNKIKVLKLNRYGYPIVDIYKDGKRRNCRIHRLVAELFIPNPLNKPQVNHISGNKLDNAVSNLEWVTGKENMQHAVLHNLISHKPSYGRRGTKNPNAGAKGKPIQIIETGEIFKSTAACARAINAREKGINDALKGRIHTHRGFHFKYIS